MNYAVIAKNYPTLFLEIYFFKSSLIYQFVRPILWDILTNIITNN